MVTAEDVNGGCLQQRTYDQKDDQGWQILPGTLAPAVPGKDGREADFIKKIEYCVIYPKCSKRAGFDVINHRGRQSLLNPGIVIHEAGPFLC